MIRAPLPSRLTPLADELGLVPLHGDIHNHCDLSYGHGRFADALARAALQLDFVSITGHAHWPDMPVDDPSVAHIVAFHVEGFARLRERWPGHFAALAAASSDRLVVFPGYEIHSAAHGDYTVIYRGEKEEARPAGEKGKNDEPEQVVAREAGGDGHELVRDRGQPLEEDDPVTILGVGLAEGRRALRQAVDPE